MNNIIRYENLYDSNVEFYEEFKSEFENVLNSGWFILGKNVAEFENEFAAYCESQHCVSLASGLDALFIALLTFNFEKGSEIIVPSNTYIATILSIINSGHKPILVEPDLSTYNIDPEKIIAKITSRTKAIMVVHLYGKCCDMKRIAEIADMHKLKVIEDCAQSHGASLDGKKAGTFGDIGAFSFYPTKNLGALGDAGAIITDKEVYYHHCRKMRNYGSDIKYKNDLVGYNSRMDELQAAFLRIKLRHLDKITKHKRNLAEIYFNNLSDYYIKPVRDERFYDVFHIFNVRTAKRDKLKAYLLENNVHTEIHYPISPNRQPAMKGIIDDQDTPISQLIHDTILSLPISYGTKEADVARICDIMNKFTTMN